MAIKCMEGPFVFRLNDNGTGPHLLVQVYFFRWNCTFYTLRNKQLMKFFMKLDRNYKPIVIRS